MATTEAVARTLRVAATKLVTTEISIGILTGLASTAAMSLIEYPIWRNRGMEAVSEWHLNQVIVGRLMHRPPEFMILPGLLLHFLHGALAGIVFVILLPSIKNISSIEAGVGFGIMLWIIALTIMKPITGVGFFGHPSRRMPLLVSLFGHILYGLILGILVMHI